MVFPFLNSVFGLDSEVDALAATSMHLKLQYHFHSDRLSRSDEMRQGSAKACQVWDSILEYMKAGLSEAFSLSLINQRLLEWENENAGSKEVRSERRRDVELAGHQSNCAVAG